MSMDFLQQIGTHVPSLAVLAFVVKSFLGHMSESRKEFQAQIKELHDGHMQAREDTREVLKNLTASMDRLAEAVRSKV